VCVCVCSVCVCVLRKMSEGQRVCERGNTKRRLAAQNLGGRM